MFRPRIIPILLLMDKGLVKTVNFSNPNYIGDPINAVKIFNEYKADELIFVDISASLNGRSISSKFVKEVGEEAFMPFSVGGGIKTIEEAESCINNGAERIILDSHACENPDIINTCAENFGRQSVIVSIDVKKSFFGKYNIYTHNGTQKQPKNIIEWAIEAQNRGAGEIMINSISQDGTMKGYDCKLVQKISSNLTIPIIAAGGAGSYLDFNEAIKFGASAVAAGSMFVYHGSRKAVLINYPDKSELSNIFK